MTSGGAGVTNGGRWRPGPIALIAAAGAVIALVNASSAVIEADQRGDRLAFIEPLTWEVSSVILIVALAPAIAWAIDRFPLSPGRLAHSGAIHLALTIPFSLAHVAGMVGLRNAAYAAFGRTYDFAANSLPLALVYEWRKDALTYAALAGLFWFFRWRAELAAHRLPATPDRIEIRDGAGAAFLDPAAIAWVEAAGNYVEFHAGARTHLVRGTLLAWETKLAPLGFARVHRSRLVNRARVRALAPTPAGDVTIILDDGRTLAGSRRYRSALS
ncbi:MAG: LytTR family transcriptional regulator [Alphaproteobacteria bacterium]|nr:LytTR family transcriptional regulator [Alphaproteobacteria bacterium]